MLVGGCGHVGLPLALAQVLLRSDVFIVGAPHHAYRELDLDRREVVDIWGVTGRGIRL